jgi:hypothetical protein
MVIAKTEFFVLLFYFSIGVRWPYRSWCFADISRHLRQILPSSETTQTIFGNRFDIFYYVSFRTITRFQTLLYVRDGCWVQSNKRSQIHLLPSGSCRPLAMWSCIVCISWKLIQYMYGCWCLPSLPNISNHITDIHAVLRNIYLLNLVLFSRLSFTLTFYHYIFIRNYFLL